MSTDDAGQNLFWKAADGSGRINRLTTDQSAQHPSSWYKNGELLLFSQCRASWHECTGIGSLTMQGDHQVDILIESQSWVSNPVLSPNGQWIAYEHGKNGKQEILVRPFPDVNSGEYLVARGDGLRMPLWAPDGRELFYLAQDSLMVVSVETSATFDYNTPHVLFDLEDDTLSYDLAPDGQRFLMVKYRFVEKSEIVLVLNWLGELERLVPTK